MMSYTHQPSILSDSDNELYRCDNCSIEFMKGSKKEFCICPSCGSSRAYNVRTRDMGKRIELETGKKPSRSDLVKDWCISFLRASYEFACNPPDKRMTCYSQFTPKKQLVRCLVYVENVPHVGEFQDSVVKELVFAIYTNQETIISSLMLLFVSIERVVEKEFNLSQNFTVAYGEGYLMARVRIEDFEELPKVAWVVG